MLVLVCGTWWPRPSQSLLAGQFGREPETVPYHSHLAEIQGLLCPEGQGVGWSGGAGQGSLSLGRGFPRIDSCQDKARHSIDRSSSCVRGDCANSIQRDPSALAPPANKVIFPNLLRQKGDTLPILVLSVQSKWEVGQS